MRSNHTKQIINEIAEEEGMDPRSIMLIVQSQFESVNRIMASGIQDDEKGFKSIKINAFGTFKFLAYRIKRMKGRKEYERIKRQRYDNKVKSTVPLHP